MMDEQPTRSTDRFTCFGAREDGNLATGRTWVTVHQDGTVEIPDDLTLDEARRCLDYLARYVGGCVEAMQEMYEAFRRVQDVLTERPAEPVAKEPDR